MDALGPRFERFLAAVEPTREGRVVACEAITGGYSRISARARVRWRDGAEETFILRGDPPPGSGVFASDRDAEWALLQALPAATPVSTPMVRWYDSSGEYLGSKAIVMDCAPARSLQDEMARADDIRPLADLFVDTFAAVHGTPLDRLPARMPRPPDWPAYLDGVLARYDRIAGEYPSSAPVLQYVTWWARVHGPPPVPLGLVTETASRRTSWWASLGRRWSSTGSSRISVTRARTLVTTPRFRSSRTCTGPIRSGSCAAIEWPRD
jgi:aminoglycoside phosphotransferase (APT) family kinase protein